MGRAFEYRRASKEKRWDKMSKLFPKLSKAITVAAKEGGGDPEMNFKLRAAIQNAKAENMPKDNIDSAIKRASDKEIKDYIEQTFEGKGPHGVLVIVETATDNVTRTTANVKSYFNKVDGNLVASGSLEFMFERKAIYYLEKDNIDPEEIELFLIDYGLEDIEIIDKEIIIYGNYTSYGNINKGLSELNIKPKKSLLKRIPTSPVNFSEDQLNDIEKMLDKMEDDEDVQYVFTNIA
ncbi:MAG: YebC/PmpR family DNA-binding transcriptional regulator [Flammeovirgaceae bacterium]|nr:YebC/PmpR family DNA-binding transcriptional regulator [Flammeovirgaceae bacterium]|tara:strand:- start:1114 stop:1821 length:708 start_codon:yes stop_codon:yes gene_type:complete